MVQNNNLSVLPFYRSIQQQNARKWWVFGRVYPLYCPTGYVLPFQVMRESLSTETFTKVRDLVASSEENDACILAGGTVIQYSGSTVSTFDVTGGNYVHILSYPEQTVENGVCGAVYDANGVSLGIFVPSEWLDENDEIMWRLPQGAATVKIVTAWDRTDFNLSELELYQRVVTSSPVTSFVIKDANTGAAVSGNLYQHSGFSIKAFSGFDVILFDGKIDVLVGMPEGRYYAELSDGTNTWYSEIWTAVGDISSYLKLEWWDDEDFLMDAGAIVYDGNFKNVVYLAADIAKPEYEFTEEGENRDGYFFPTKYLSEKRYKFSFLASEYMLDVLRFVRMADYIKITNAGDVYAVDSFLITPEWEKEGDVAGVQAEFQTATVAKKIGVGYLRARQVQAGDFNADFNNDFLNG